MKKGQAEVIEIVIAGLFIVFILIYFASYFFLQDITHVDLKQNLKEIRLDSGNKVLLNYLKTVDVNSWYYSKEGDFEKKTEEIFKKLYGRCYDLKIFDEKGVIKEFGSPFGGLKSEVQVAVYNKKLRFVLDLGQYNKYKDKGVCYE